MILEAVEAEVGEVVQPAMWPADLPGTTTGSVLPAVVAAAAAAAGLQDIEAADDTKTQNDIQTELDSAASDTLPINDY